MLAAATAPLLTDAFECEAQVLEALMYRNRNQHGRARYWKRLQHVRRLLRELALPELVAMAQAAQQDLLALRGSSSSGSSKKQAAALGLLRAKGRALQVAAGQCALVLRACLGCSDALAVEVAQGYFLNLAILLLALLGRIHALVRHAGAMALYVGQALLQHGEGADKLRQGHEGIPWRLAGALLLRKERRAGAKITAEGETGSTVVGKGQEGRGERPQQGGAEEEDDDVGVALGPALAALAPPPAAAPPRVLTTRVIPPVAKGKARASGRQGGAVVVGAQGRALLATEYSSSSEEEEEETIEAMVAPAVVQEKETADDVEDEGALGFVIDREPEPPPLDAEEEGGAPPPAKKSKKAEDEQKGKPRPAAAIPLHQQPTQPSLPSIGRKRKKKQKAAEPTAGRGKGASLLDAIDAIFQSAGVASKTTQKKKQKK